jgi:GR25 family glycosyltransferase involved in LPS biosynthesis
MEFNLYTNVDLPPSLQDPAIDCALILTLKNSDRTRGAIYSARAFSGLVSQLVVQTNPGYRNTKKPLPAQTAEADCAFSHYAACKYSLEQGFATVLVLEDDFIVEPELDEYKYVINRDIGQFMEKWRVDHYFLGCLPYLVIPSGAACGGSWRVIKGGTAHAVIHSRSGMQKIVRGWESSPDELLPVDWYMFSNRAFMHAKPLVSQTFPATKNRTENWGSDSTVLGIISNFFISTLELDEITQPGYDMLYSSVKNIPLLVAFITTCAFVILLINNRPSS